MASPAPEWIYVLKLEDDCIYVGKTKHPIIRLEQHRNNNGSAWTRLHPPIDFLVPPRKLESSSEGGLEEDKETKKWMMQKGIQFVRGGAYSQCELPPAQLSSLQREQWHHNDSCLRCGRKGNWAKNCDQTTDVNGMQLPPKDGVIKDIIVHQLPQGCTGLVLSGLPARLKVYPKAIEEGTPHLKRFVAPNLPMGLDGECSKCGNILIPGTVVYGCRDCDYDLCFTCRPHTKDPECWPDHPLEGTYQPVPERFIHGGIVLENGLGAFCFRSSNTGKWIFTDDEFSMAEDIGAVRIDSLTERVLVEVYEPGQATNWCVCSTARVTLEMSGGGGDGKRARSSGGSGSGVRAQKKRVRSGSSSSSSSSSNKMRRSCASAGCGSDISHRPEDHSVCYKC